MRSVPTTGYTYICGGGWMEKDLDRQARHRTLKKFSGDVRFASSCVACQGVTSQPSDRLREKTLKSPVFTVTRWKILEFVIWTKSISIKWNKNVLNFFLIFRSIIASFLLHTVDISVIYGFDIRYINIENLWFISTHPKKFILHSKVLFDYLETGPSSWRFSSPQKPRRVLTQDPEGSSTPWITRLDWAHPPNPSQTKCSKSRPIPSVSS